MPGTPDDKLGIYTSGRSPIYFKANADVTVLRSTTVSMVDNYSMAKYNWLIETKGGAIQYFTTSQELWMRTKL